MDISVPAPDPAPQPAPDSAPVPRLERLPSGIAGLDTILRGGFFQGDLYLIAGEPGTGKTILTNQLSFNHVARGGRAVYVTLLVETHARMLAHLQSLAFFAPAAVAHTLHYISGAAVLQEQGLDALLALLTGVVRQYQATLLVVEGFDTAQMAAPSELALKHFLQVLQVGMDVHRCTTFLVAQSGASGLQPIRAAADGLIELRDTRIGQRRVRELEVVKLRGSGYLRNAHAFQITDAGIMVYPRTEALVALPPPPLAAPRVRLGFANAGLDEMTRGGPFARSCTMLLGAPGSGKTLLGLQFLAAGARRGEQGLYFGFDEPAEWLVAKADAVGLGFSEHVAAQRIDLVWQAPLDSLLDELAERLLARVRARQVRRLFIDGLSGLEHAQPYPEHMFAFFTGLVLQLRALGVTTVFSVEVGQLIGSEIALPAEYASGATDNIFFLRYVELNSHLYRLISIMKMRDSGYDTALREFAITEQGIAVEATFASAEAILTGIARPAPPEWGGRHGARPAGPRAAGEEPGPGPPPSSTPAGGPPASPLEGKQGHGP
jgi:circadian clock protein KaiC